jgi:DNA topoisomerase-1
MKSQKYWTTLEYNGPAVYPPYTPKGLHISINGESVSLSPLAEEMAYHLAKKKDTPYIKDPFFISNFMKDFSKELPQKFRNVSFEKIDFSEFYRYVDTERVMKEKLSKEERKKQAQERKLIREQMKEKHGYAILDGNKIEVANWMIEPPGLFMGRGAHPLRGRWKSRVEESDVELNVSEDFKPPGNWRNVLHDHNSMWLARWTDKLTGKIKYVWPHDSSHLLQQKNKEKYDRAMRLGSYLDKIRARISKGMDSKDPKVRKIATVCYLIDRLGMRVGDEKDEDEADTVGATTLRVEHVKISGNRIDFDFLGKDSVRWEKSIECAEPNVIRNIEEFTAGKAGKDQIFDGVNSRMVNAFFQKISKDITAKTFRTFHATMCVKSYLSSIKEDLTHANEDVKLYQAKLANLEAAIMCNHKRTPPKNWEESLKKKKDQLSLLESVKPKSEKEAQRLELRKQKLRLAIDLAERTRDYNLNTSLKNYIDPRVYKSWCNYVGLDWKRLYTKSLQRKFEWISKSHQNWIEAKKPALEIKMITRS